MPLPDPRTYPHEIVSVPVIFPQVREYGTEFPESIQYDELVLKKHRLSTGEVFWGTLNRRPNPLTVLRV